MLPARDRHEMRANIAEAFWGFVETMQGQPVQEQATAQASAT